MKIYNIATIGTSSIASEFMETVKDISNARLHTVYSRDINKAASVASKYGALKYTDSLSDICEDSEVDAVYIASPNSFHAPQTEMMIDAGKNVFCEKPLFDNNRTTKRLIEKAKSKGVLLMEAYKTAYMPEMKLISDNISKLGKIRSAFFPFGKYSSRYDAHLRGENVNTFKNEFSNGGLLDMGIYGIYPSLMLFGEPKSVMGTASIVDGGVDGVGFVTLGYGDFCTCVHYSKVSNSFLPCEISGENGTMTIDRINIPKKIEIVYKNGDREVLLDKSVKAENMSAALHTFEGMRGETLAFVKALDDGIFDVKPEGSLLTSHEISLAGSRITDEVRKMIGLSYPSDDL